MAIEKVLALSTAHMPSTRPEFELVKHLKFPEGYIVFVCQEMLDQPGRCPEWLIPIMWYALQEKCTLILFDMDANTDPAFEEWDW